MDKRKCQCEHIAHFDRTKRTPKGHVTHSYAFAYRERDMRVIETERGLFAVCEACKEDCHGTQS